MPTVGFQNRHSPINLIVVIPSVKVGYDFVLVEAATL